MSTEIRPTSVQPVVSIPRIPPLAPGDRLSEAEFVQRYEADRSHQKAELLDGVVFMAPPVSGEDHAYPHYDLTGWMSAYSFQMPGVRGGLDATLRLGVDNLPQPDAFLAIIPEAGGQSRAGKADRFVVGAPELVAEIAATSANYDLNDKLKIYLQSGVREYLVWRTIDEEFDWFIRSPDGKRYEPLRADAQGLLKSQVFPGLWLDVRALLSGNKKQLLGVLQKGLASPECAAFAATLQAKLDAKK